MKTLTADQLKACLSYDPETGLFTRKNGKPAGYIFEMRYIRIKIDDVEYQAHRLAWLYMTGAMPEETVDHIDGDGLNNKFANLRAASRVQNNHNSRAKPRKRNLPRGVNPVSSGRFCAMISIKNKKKHLGTFDTPEEAGEFYQLAADMLHGEFAYHRCQGAAAKEGAQ